MSEFDISGFDQIKFSEFRINVGSTLSNIISRNLPVCLVNGRSNNDSRSYLICTFAYFEEVIRPKINLIVENIKDEFTCDHIARNASRLLPHNGNKPVVGRHESSIIYFTPVSIIDNVDKNSNEHFSIGDLWTSALIDPTDQFTSIVRKPIIENLFKAINQHHSDSILKLGITELQHKAHQQRKDIFHSNRNVIITGGTSSGKSYILEIMAVTAALLNKKALYIVPTRALAQQKFNELTERYGRPESGLINKDEIILSTGEDYGNDSRFYNNNYGVFVTVYEKANSLIAKSDSTLANIDIVLIDELQMIGEEQRGPLLETLLAKCIFTRKVSQSRLSGAFVAPRIVGVSTERIDQENTSPIVKAFTDNSGTPVLIHSSIRPGFIKHLAVLPAFDNKGNFFNQNVELMTCEDQLPQYVFPNQLQNITEKFHQYSIYNAKNWNKFVADASVKSINRLVVFLKKYVENCKTESTHNTKKRILVFFQSVAELMQALKQTKNVLKNFQTDDVSEELVDEINISEDKTDAAAIIDGMKCGIFVHFAELGREVRNANAMRFRNAVAEKLFCEVIFATSTIAYGVNFVVDDIVIFGLAANKGDGGGIKEIRTSEIGGSWISPSLFQNMVGRAARLNNLVSQDSYTAAGLTRDADANVYMFFREIELGARSTGFMTRAVELTAKFYHSFMTVKTKLFNERDIGAVSNRNSEKGLQALIQFSDETVRAVYDVVRFASSIHDSSGANGVAAFDDILKIFECFLINYDDITKEKSIIIKNVIKAIIELSTENSFYSLNGRAMYFIKQKSSDEYVLSDEGSALIDTGTELSSVVPMLMIAEKIAVIIGKHNECDETLRLMLVPAGVQSEANRQFISRMIEKRLTSEFIDEIRVNEDGVLKAFIDTVEHSICSKSGKEIGNEVVMLIKDVINNGLLAQRIFPNADVALAAYVRMSDFLLRWTDGMGVRKCRNAITRDYNRSDLEETGRNRVTGSYGERTSWRLTMLARVLAPSYEPELAKLARRAQWGCKQETLAYHESGLPRRLIYQISQSEKALTVDACVRETQRLNEFNQICISNDRNAFIDFPIQFAKRSLAQFLTSLASNRKPNTFEETFIAHLAELISDLEEVNFKKFVALLQAIDQHQNAEDIEAYNPNDVRWISGNVDIENAVSIGSKNDNMIAIISNRGLESFEGMSPNFAQYKFVIVVITPVLDGRVDCNRVAEIVSRFGEQLGTRKICFMTSATFFALQMLIPGHRRILSVSHVLNWLNLRPSPEKIVTLRELFELLSQRQIFRGSIRMSFANYVELNHE